MIRRLLITCVSALFAITVHAQAPAPAAVPDATAAKPFHAEPSPLTDVEKKGIETLTLKAQLTTAYKQIADLQAAVGACQAQLGPAQFEQNRQALAGEQAALKDAIEKARPGFTWDPDTGKFTPKPDPPKATDGKPKQ